MSTQDYTVTGMSCAHCENAIRGEVSQLPGVTDVRVDATAGTLAVSADAPIDDAAVIAAVDEAGYTAARA